MRTGERDLTLFRVLVQTAVPGAGHAGCEGTGS